MTRTTVKATVTHYRPELWGARPPMEGRRTDRARRAPRAQRHSDRRPVRRQERPAVPGHLRRSRRRRRRCSSPLGVRDRRHHGREPADHQCRRAVRPQPRHQPGSSGGRSQRDTRPTRSSPAWARSTRGTSGRHVSVSPRSSSADGRTMLRAQLRTVQPGRADRRAQPLPSWRDRRPRPGFDRGDRRATRRSRVVVDPQRTCSSIPACARRTPTSTRSASIARSAGGSRWRSRTCARSGARFHRMDRRRRSVRREDARIAADGRSRAGVRADTTRGRSPLSADESRRLLADLQRPRDGRRETSRRTAGRRLGSYTFSQASGLQAVERHDRRWRAGQHRRRLPTGARSDAIRTISPTRAAGCRTIARTCFRVMGASTCRGPASSSPPTFSTSAASRGPRRRR